MKIIHLIAGIILCSSMMELTMAQEKQSGNDPQAQTNAASEQVQAVPTPQTFPATGSVQAKRLNVRARPGTRYEVIGRFEAGQTITIVGEKDDWYEVEVPKDAKAWIADQFIDAGGIVTGNDVRVRAGAGLAFSHYGYVHKGEKVTTKGAPFSGWQQIEPPHTATAWVSREYITIQPQQTPKLPDQETAEASETDEQPPADQTIADSTTDEQDQSSAQPAETTETEQTPTNTPAELADTDITLKKPEGETDEEILPPGPAGAVMREGKIVTVNDIKESIATHALVREVEGISITLCYLRSKRIDLSTWQNRSVRIYGTEMWYHGWRRPVINVTGVQFQTPSSTQTQN